MEDQLSKMFKQMGGMDLNAMTRMMLVNALQQFRAEIDKLIQLYSQAGWDPYKVLGVNPNSNKSEVYRAYRGKARRFHPDVPGGDNEKMAEINLAYEQICRLRRWKI